MKDALNNWRVKLLTICVVVSLLFITNIVPLNRDNGIGFGKGLDYGLDFSGGTQLQLRLEYPLDSDIMAIEKEILENRLNSLGLKDIPVRPWGSQYILIQVAGASPADIGDIEDILRQQAHFEQRIDGELALVGDEITVDLSPQGTQVYNSGNGFGWSVSLSLNSEGACRFGEVATGKKDRPVDIFLDRPRNTTILMGAGTYGVLRNMSSLSDSDDLYFGDSALTIITNRSNIPVIALGQINDTLAELNAYKDLGYTNVILAGDDARLSENVRNILEDAGFKTERNAQLNQTYEDWIKDLTGLQSSPRLSFDPRDQCVYSAQITGNALTSDEAINEVKTNQVLLTSGNLPAKAYIGAKSTIPPTLGTKFLRYGLLTGILAVFAVAVFIYIRYRKLIIAIPMMLINLSEIIIILGLAAMINWQLDLPALAGIIAAVGTGIDHLIVITDQTLTDGRKKEKRIISMRERIRSSFFIIFTAAATIIAAMLPLLGIGAGMLKGFAFTTILGVMVGVGIARPAYAKIIGTVLKD